MFLLDIIIFRALTSLIDQRFIFFCGDLGIPDLLKLCLVDLELFNNFLASQ